jgi:succinate dehydrogenase / fumarate reductase membrane anchor subunit
MVNRIVVGAHYGLRDWLIQRVTAVVMAAGCLALVIYLLLHPHLGYDRWTGLFSSQPVRAFALLFLLSLFYHAWIGMRDIVMDYVNTGADAVWDLVGANVVGNVNSGLRIEDRESKNGGVFSVPQSAFCIRVREI